MKSNSSKIGILSLGCPRNLVDSGSILGRLKANGHSLVDIEQADIAIVNTCAFIEEAKRESVDAILDLIDLKKAGSIKKIIVYGCLSQRYAQELIKQFPEIDAFVGKISLAADNCKYSQVNLAARHFGYLKICEGCINSCSYCVIPVIKGRLQSLDTGSVLAQAKRFNRQNLSELNVIGQDITGYGIDLYGKQALPGLIKEILKVTGNIRWLRLLYLYPSRVSEELIDLMARENRICKYIDLPLQHINDRILKLMNRSISKSEIMRLVSKIRKKIPSVAIRTSFIVGFPSESEKEFNEMIEFIKQARFERLGAFIYSREEGTRAYVLKGQISQKVKEERFKEVMSVQAEVARQVNAGFLNKTMEVLIDAKQDGVYLGRSQYDAPEVDGCVYVHSPRPLKAGDFAQVRITDTLEYDLVGEAL